MMPKRFFGLKPIVLPLALIACSDVSQRTPVVQANPYTRFAEFMAAGDVEGLAALFADSATYRDRTFDFEVQGRDAIRGVMQSTIEGFGKPRLEIRRMIVQGEQVMVEWVLHGTFVGPILGMSPDSNAIQLEGVSIGMIENGLIRDQTDYLDRAALAERIGMAR